MPLRGLFRSLLASEGVTQMTGEKMAGPKTRPNYCLLTGKPHDISNQIDTSSLIVYSYQLINKAEHQTAHARLPALIAADRLIDNLIHLFTTYSGTPKVRKASIEQLASKISRAIGEMAKGHISAICINFPIGGDVAIYGLRNCAAGNEPVVTLDVTMNGRISERYCQGSTL